MSQTEVKLYDDSVIRLTIKQGTEKERFPVTIGSGQFTTEDDLLDSNKINSVSGALVSGELGYTRDTHRLFVGNISESSGSQQTLGGTLVGNKYLGFIDSYDLNGSSTPLSLSSEGSGLLEESSIYRSYNFRDNGSAEPTLTNDKKWQCISYYNEKYDAYDGDYMYDMYRNAIILFDHNITSSKDDNLADSMRGKRKTVLKELETNIDNSEITIDDSVKNHTKDMYGDGYVLFYNIIPDGETLTFANRNGKNNNSYNIIKLNKVPASVLSQVLDSNYFQVAGDRITLKENGGSNNGGGSDSLLNDLTGASHDTLVKITNNEGIIKLSKTDILADDVEWLTTNLSENTIGAFLEKEGFATKKFIENLTAPIPDFTENHSLDLPTDTTKGITIDLTLLRSIVNTNGNKIEDVEIKNTTYFLHFGGIGEITLTHSYKESDTSSTSSEPVIVSVSGSLKFGSKNNYSESLIPFKLDEEDETIVLKGDNIAKAIIIPAK